MSAFWKSCIKRKGNIVAHVLAKKENFAGYFHMWLERGST